MLFIAFELQNKPIQMPICDVMSTFLLKLFDILAPCSIWLAINALLFFTSKQLVLVTTTINQKVDTFYRTKLFTSRYE